MMDTTNEQISQKWTILNLDHVCTTLSAWTGIPPERLTSGTLNKVELENLRQKLGEQVFGQQPAIDVAVFAIQRRFDLPELEGVHQPVWSALFAGPSGVGKTKLAREIADHFFGDVNRYLIKVDLSEFREEHTLARLVGAPPGYVGHGSGGQLTNALRQISSGVVLLDEVEKAHPAILTTVLLPMIGDGIIHDMNDGRSLDVSSMIVIMTSNIGTNLSGERAVGFAQEARSEEAVIRTTIQAYFPKEVLGRIDDIIIFSPLSDEAIQLIWHREVVAFETRLAARGDQVKIEIDAVAEAIALDRMRRAVSNEGARAVLRFFNKVVVDRCLSLLRNKTNDAYAIRIEPTEEGGLRYRLVE